MGSVMIFPVSSGRGDFICRCWVGPRSGLSRRPANGRYGWAAAGSREDAERVAVESLGMTSPPLPDLGSASTRPARVVVSACTKNAA